MGTIDLEYSDRAPGELLGQLERGKGFVSVLITSLLFALGLPFVLL